MLGREGGGGAPALSVRVGYASFRQWRTLYCVQIKLRETLAIKEASDMDVENNKPKKSGQKRKLCTWRANKEN